MSSSPAGIDPRGPRFAAGITATLLAITVVLGLIDANAGFVVLVIVAALFAWGVVSPRTAPWGVLFRAVVAPKLAKPTELEDPRPPRFAQAVGLTVTLIGVILHLTGVPYVVPIAAGIAFIAAFLNAVFNFCLGCQMYLALARLKPHRAA